MTTTTSQGAPGPSRPAIHFTAREGWINDPVGLRHHDGRYHLFYQAVPGSTTWQPGCSWGHASSADLHTWTEHPAALSPGDGDLGCWSGDLVEDGAGRPVIFYTSVTEPDLALGTVRTARPRDPGWVDWEKGEALVHPPTDHDVAGFRDPSVVRDGDTWRMLVGAGYRDGRAAVLSYTSPDLTSWTFTGTAVEEEQGDRAEPHVWECPHLVRVGDTAVLVVSLWIAEETTTVHAAVGDYEEGRFTPRRWTQLTHGAGHYAPTAFTGPDGEPHLIFWIRGIGGEEQGWAGALSVPYALEVTPEDEVTISPLPDLLGTAAAGAHLVTWSPGSDPRPVARPLVRPDGTVAATLARVGTDITVTTTAGQESVPWNGGPVTAILDGPVLEVRTGAGVCGLAAPAALPVAEVTEGDHGPVP